eukprot:15816-Heterococcus_DN1.PRE.2
MFFGYMGAAEGLSPSAIKSRIKNNLWASVKGSWTVWPVAHAINFRFVPTSQRLLYINSIQFASGDSCTYEHVTQHCQLRSWAILAKRANAPVADDLAAKGRQAGRKVADKGRDVKRAVKQRL